MARFSAGFLVPVTKQRFRPWSRPRCFQNLPVGVEAAKGDTMKRPYFKKTHQAWYVNQGKDKPPIRLGKTEDEAMTAWAALQAAPAAAPAQAAGLTLADLVKEWLAWVLKSKSKETHRSYKHYCTGVM